MERGPASDSHATGGTRAQKVINRTRNQVLADRAVVAETGSERRRGLIGRAALEEGEALIIHRCRQVHTFGMRFTIDVLFVDKSGEVTCTCSELKPRRISVIARGAHTAIELPAETISRTGTLPGDLISIEE